MAHVGQKTSEQRDVCQEPQYLACFSKEARAARDWITNLHPEPKPPQKETLRNSYLGYVELGS